MKAIALGLLLSAIVVACAAQPRPSAPPMAPNAHDQIEQLARKIDANKQSLGLGGVQPHVAMATPNACVRSETDTCKQVCTLSDSICDDAKKICELADGMPGDAWAKDKCDSARATCSEATERCCKCS